MPRVVPSQVVALIEQLFRGVQNQRDFQPTKGFSNHFAAIVELVDRIPDDLLRLDVEDFSHLRISVAAIRNQIEDWRIRDSTFHGIGGLPHPVELIRSCLAKCPDEAPGADTVGLTFIQDTDLRESIRLDISAANSDLATGEWKGATVLAGSAVEALLLWALQEREKNKSGDVRAAVGSLVGQALNRDPGPDLEGQGWHLHEYVEAAAHLNIIKPDTATLVRLAKGFRNLIHPGRAARLGQKCDRATALGALAAVEAVARDLAP